MIDIHNYLISLQLSDRYPIPQQYPDNHIIISYLVQLIDKDRKCATVRYGTFTGDNMQAKLDKIKEKFKSLKQEAENDCSFDKKQMDKHFNNTYTTMKWINKKQEWNDVYRIYEQKRKEKFRALWEYYSTEADLKISTKEEKFLFIESDIQYYEYQMLTDSVKEILKYIDSVIECLKNKNYEIQRYIQWHMFMNGK
jgi:hypothetical protein